MPPAGQTIATVNPLGQRTSYSYDLAGNRVHTMNPLGNITTTLYDANSRVQATINPLLARTTLIYNANNDPLATVSPLGARTTTVYDASHRPVATIDPLLHRTTTVYNANSQTVATIDPMNSRTTSIYDANGQRIATINALGNRTTTVYDAAGREQAMINAKGNRYSYTYDAAGRKTQMIDPLGRRTTSLYDTAGQQITRIDAKGVRTSYTYNGIGQVLGRQYPDGSRTTFAYDSRGNRSLSENSDIRTTTTYDALNRPLSVTTDMDTAKKTIGYQYDPVGNRSRMIDPDGGRFTYSYDTNQNLTSIRNPQNDRTSFSYDAAGRRTLKELANGTKATFLYDAASNITRVANLKSNDSVISQYDYSYNAANKRTKIATADGGLTTYSYDAIYQLTEEHRTGPSPYRHTYAYDPVQNRTVKVIDGVRTTSTFDSANQLEVELTGPDRATFTFDNNGNEILVLQPNGSRTTTLWDDENNSIVIVTPANGIQTSVYDPDNLRAKKIDQVGTTHFVYDGQAYLLETNDSNITVAVYTQEPTTYGYLASQYRFDGSLWKPSYFHQDALGSTMQLTDESENLTDTYGYDVWGNILSRTGTTENPFQWIGAWGYYKDEATGLYYVRARDLRPANGRWRSADPLLFIDGPNLYVAYFVPNGVDPSGLMFGWGYGKYCGFSRRASCPPGSGPAPMDALDAACERHDCCQATVLTCNPYHLSKCTGELCAQAKDAADFGCAQSWGHDKAKREGCRSAAYDVILLFCLPYGTNDPRKTLRDAKNPWSWGPHGKF